MNKKAQIWIETVIYILLGLVLISLVLAFVTPRINEQKDRTIVEQTIISLNNLDEIVNGVINNGRDNRRIAEFSIKAGELNFNSGNDEIVFILNQLEKPYSQPGVKIPLGRIVVETIEGRKTSSVSLTLPYTNFADLTFAGSENSEKFNPSSLPYKFSIENEGVPAGESLYNIDIKEIS